MSPECPRCQASSTRRRPRSKTLGHQLMYFFGLYPWECLTCQEKFFSGTRYSRSGRNPVGEIYTETRPKPVAKPGSEERPSQ
jgi:hypothetical protein